MVKKKAEGEKKEGELIEEKKIEAPVDEDPEKNDQKGTPNDPPKTYQEILASFE